MTLHQSPFQTIFRHGPFKVLIEPFPVFRLTSSVKSTRVDGRAEVKLVTGLFNLKEIAIKRSSKVYIVSTETYVEMLCTTAYTYIGNDNAQTNVK